MFLALLVFHIYHPGKVLVGPDSEYPKLTKEEKKAAKEEKRAAKERRREEKRRIKEEKRMGRGGFDMEKGVSDGSGIVAGDAEN